MTTSENSVARAAPGNVQAADRGGPAQPLVIARDLKRHFPVRKGIFNRKASAVRAVDGISFTVRKSETLGIVGESGCGKSTTARLLVGLIGLDEGDLIFDGEKLGEELSLNDLWSGVQMVFQDSYASLNPRLTIEETIAFGPKMRGVAAPEARRLAHELLERVGLAPARFAGRYPHELSGGQRQRVNIARSLAMKPRLIILDEAVSALDKSVEAQVLNLLRELKAEFDLTFVFISHDLNVVRYVSDRIMVMYLGEVVEIGPVDAIWNHRAHPYTQALFAAMPSMDPDNRTQVPPLAGDPPNPIDPPSGCRFHTRCGFAEPVCGTRKPRVVAVRGDAGHEAACHMLDGQSGHSKAGETGEVRKELGEV
ncbi:ABC transporter ATP-binding protein [Jiella mangrovi]|uniref:Glutathione import ATP-binding protein GsiA n=1 Tax=Jiella mangrovi TaxID=2821407 RepID=A0ABS4BCV8_9HYPH|nr:ABC transporter ATP-binding protein [Jiella mangrovi]MBP0614589.1 ABC transporter ATP-binding protein [Jiella mangrovi]